MATIGKITTVKSKFHSGMATKPTMAKLFETKPQLARSFMTELLSQKQGKSLEQTLMGIGTKEFMTDDEYYWNVIGSSRMNIELVEARKMDGTKVTTGNVGANGEEFVMVFPFEFFHEGNVITGERPDIYQCIIKKIRIEGTGQQVCTCEMINGNTTGMPAEEVAPGKRYSFEFNPVSSELSKQRFGGNITTPTDMRGEFSTLRYGHKVTGTADAYTMNCEIKGNDGKLKKFGAWMPYIQWKIEQEFAEMKNRLLVYARTNRNQEGLYLNRDHKTGITLKVGSGFREQMEVSNTIFYGKFQIELIENLLFELSEGKLGFADRVFVMKTGERGAKQFSKAVQDLASGWSTVNYFGGSNNPSIIKNTSSELHDNALSFGYQFVEFRAPNNVTLRVEVDPIYDDTIRNKMEHPEGGVVESYRYDIYYIGTKDDPNMQIATVKGKGERRGFQGGPFGNPFLGTVSDNSAAWDEDSGVMHVQTTLGSILYDPSRTASLIPNMMQ